MKLPSALDGLARVPSFGSWDPSSITSAPPYVAFGELGIALAEQAEQGVALAAGVAAAFALVERMLASPDDDVANLAQVGVLEVLMDTPRTRALARAMLQGDARDAFEDCVRRWAPQGDSAHCDPSNGDD